MDADLTTDERALIAQLRTEASELKDCFVRYSFQALSVSALGLGVIARLQQDTPYMGLTAIPIIILLLVVARMGTYKYQSANRLYGYELHLHRVARLKSPAAGGWRRSMREIGWEEAMRAWRVVQATMFEQLYTTETGWRNWARPNRLRDPYRREAKRWFDPETLVVDGTTWYAGSYLDTLLSIIHAVAAGCLIPLFAMAVQLSEPERWIPNLTFPRMAYQISGISIFAVVAFVLAMRIRQNSVRQAMVESGFLSIHSNAIMWQAVVAAHHRALRKVGLDIEGQVDHYRGYTEALSELARELKVHCMDIHGWIDGDWEVNSATASQSR